MIMSVNVKRIRFVSLVIYIKLFIILYYFMHLIFFHIEWWMLKFFTNKCLSDLLSNYCKLYMKKFLLIFYKNSENNKYMLWICNIMFFNLKISNEKSNLEYFIVQNKIEIFLFIKKHAQFQCCHK